MPEATQTEPIVREQWVNARPETVYAFFVETEKATRWLAAEVVADPRPGGVYEQVHVDHDGVRHLMRGSFIALEPPSRLVFAWDFGGGDSTVEVTLEPERGGTLVRLTHRDLPASVRADHEAGWKELLGRLSAAV